jgi:hypothetical protein
MSNVVEHDVYKAKHDGFIGVLVGTYTTLQGMEGVVLQQMGTRVVHVYRKESTEFLGVHKILKEKE